MSFATHRAAEVDSAARCVASLCGKGVAVAADVVVRDQDVGLLLGYQLANGQGQVLLESVGVGFFCFVFAAFGSLEESMISAAQLGLDIGPDTLDRCL